MKKPINISITDYQGFKIRRVRNGAGFMAYCLISCSILGVGGFFMAGGRESLLAWFFVAFAVMLLISFGLAFILTLRRDSEIEQLLKSGNKLSGRVTDILKVGLRGAQYYKLVVTVGASGGSGGNFQSDKLDGVGRLAITDYRNDPFNLDVYVNPANPERYYVDISTIDSLSKDEISEVYRMAKDSQQN